MTQRTLTYLALFSVCILILTFFIPTFDTNAFFGGSTGGMSPFGGTVQKMTFCTCSATILLKVGGPVGGDFMVTLGTKIYANYNFMLGNWLLGLAAPASIPCMVYKGNSCTQEGSGKPITMMGTS